ncbi:endonuclease domain-containing protein [Psychroflexus salis]|uniref:endonuclease domain-containing protein n=1 Tax=Psychroflexus salis TaxID=1526574 RepID=UPI003570C568
MFYNHQLKLCIEVDGEYHNSKEQREHDSKRDEFLRFNGITTIRFTNHEIENQIEVVMNKLKTVITKLTTK